MDFGVFKRKVARSFRLPKNLKFFFAGENGRRAGKIKYDNI